MLAHAFVIRGQNVPAMTSGGVMAKPSSVLRDLDGRGVVAQGLQYRLIRLQGLQQLVDRRKGDDKLAIFSRERSTEHLAGHVERLSIVISESVRPPCERRGIPCVEDGHVAKGAGVGRNKRTKNGRNRVLT